MVVVVDGVVAFGRVDVVVEEVVLLEEDWFGFAVVLVLDDVLEDEVLDELDVLDDVLEDVDELVLDEESGEMVREGVPCNLDAAEAESGLTESLRPRKDGLTMANVAATHNIATRIAAPRTARMICTSSGKTW